jgi:hypothetical protein
MVIITKEFCSDQINEDEIGDTHSKQDEKRYVHKVLMKKKS